MNTIKQMLHHWRYILLLMPPFHFHRNCYN